MSASQQTNVPGIALTCRHPLEKYWIRLDLDRQHNVVTGWGNALVDFHWLGIDAIQTFRKRRAPYREMRSMLLFLSYLVDTQAVLPLTCYTERLITRPHKPWWLQSLPMTPLGRDCKMFWCLVIWVEARRDEFIFVVWVPMMDLPSNSFSWVTNNLIFNAFDLLLFENF
jgi:hypothetical protein